MQVEAEPEDFLLSSYGYSLPEAQIAQFPSSERGASRLLVLQNAEAPLHELFARLAELLPPQSLLVANNSRVMPARLIGRRQSGGRAQFLLLSPLALLKPQQIGPNSFKARVNGLIRPAGKIRTGAKLAFGPQLSFIVGDKGEFGHCDGELFWQGDLNKNLEATGLLPLPPYIKREPEATDSNRYQTVYAKNPGSVAAPTAGLHFTETLRQKLLDKGHEWAELSLHVGYGTFSPVRCEDIRQHKMHSEYVELGEPTAKAINRALAKSRPIIAVGTTSLRAMEGVAAKLGRVGPYNGMINLFLYPGQPVKIASGIITNFHLPCSTLLMLVAAMTGRKRILSAYEEAVRSGYRFFSYGDAMLIY